MTEQTQRPEEQRPDAEATALYRIHLIIIAAGWDNPQSFRTVERAATFEEAWGAAVKSLNSKAEAKGWDRVSILSYASGERVPDTEQDYAPCVCHKGVMWDTDRLTSDGHCPEYSPQT